MKKLNNKGFAIMGILYTILILFCLILVSILSGLSTRNTFLMKAVDNLSNHYEEKEISLDEKKAPADGKYVYYGQNPSQASTYQRCYKFLKKGDQIPKDGDGICTTVDESTESIRYFYELK